MITSDTTSGPAHSKPAFLFVGAMFAAVWAVSAWLTLFFCIFSKTVQQLKMPQWMLITLVIMGVIFSIACAAMLLYRKHILASPIAKL